METLVLVLLALLVLLGVPIGYVLLAASLAEIHAEPADAHGPDRVVAGREMSLRELIEDELILAVPYAPRHESCTGTEAGERTGTSSPFAGLRGMMRGKH